MAGRGLRSREPRHDGADSELGVVRIRDSHRALGDIADLLRPSPQRVGRVAQHNFIADDVRLDAAIWEIRDQLFRAHDGASLHPWQPPPLASIATT